MAGCAAAFLPGRLYSPPGLSPRPGMCLAVPGRDPAAAPLSAAWSALGAPR